MNNFFSTNIGLRNFRYIVFFALFIFLIVSYQEALAYETFFPTYSARAAHPPTYCIIESSSYGTLPYYLVGRYLHIYKEAVFDWSEKLQDADPMNKELWKMDAKVFLKDEIIEYENCDIKVYFKFRSESISTPTAVAYYNPGDKSITMKLDIYGTGTGSCENYVAHIISWCVDGIVLRNLNSVFDVAQHEIGHSIGLGHFTSDDEDLNLKWVTTMKSPSIMVPNDHNQPHLIEITDRDISKVQEIYGAKGFYAFSNEEDIPSGLISEPETITEPTNIPAPPKIPVFPFASTGIFSANNENLNDKSIQTGSTSFPTMVKVSGMVSESEFYRGVPVYLLIIKPDETSETLKLKTMKSGYFETPLMFDRNSPLGEYKIQAIYLENADEKMDIVFKVADS